MTRQKVLVQEDFQALLRRILTVSALAPGIPEGGETAYNPWSRAQSLDQLGTGLPPLINDSRDDAVGESAVGNIGYAVKISTASNTLFKDRIFVFPGDKTPFVLHYAGMRHVPGLGMQPYHELLRNCYLDKFTDSEGMRNFETEKHTVYIV
ncbi:hypothetical protein F5B21DRAFT_508864 [Xylaria acuta]|nr:hypothetical protein F5B21DRAFT_508864 [Xylaria acuta]